MVQYPDGTKKDQVQQGGVFIQSQFQEDGITKDQLQWGVIQPDQSYLIQGQSYQVQGPSNQPQVQKGGAYIQVQ